MNAKKHLQNSRQYDAPMCIVMSAINTEVLCVSVGLDSLTEQDMDGETTWSY
ncbi:MAG: hypothetical protein MJY62_00650 [Bacteroidales bacterium]|nr:hypothetical protein [Bacteroidales bacterium]